MSTAPDSVEDKLLKILEASYRAGVTLATRVRVGRQRGHRSGTEEDVPSTARGRDEPPEDSAKKTRGSERERGFIGD